MRRIHGFTLVEVLVALAIISLVLVALLRMEASSIAMTARTNITFRALTMATKEMDDLEMKKFTGEEEKKIDAFTLRAKTETKSYEGIPLEKLTLEVLYDDRKFSELGSYRLKAF